MQIGIDLGASKIESVVLSDDGKEHLRERENTPQSYNHTINLIKKIVVFFQQPQPPYLRFEILQDALLHLAYQLHSWDV